MTDRRFGGYSDVIEVTMAKNETVIPTPDTPADPDIGARWGKLSQFQFSSTNPAEDPGNGNNTGRPTAHRRSTEYRFETRIESFNEVKREYYRTLTFEDTDGIFNWNPPTPRTIWVDMGDETRQEIVGFTAYADGSVVERFKDVEVNRILVMAMEYTYVKWGSQFLVEGEIPPLYTNG